MGKALDFFDAGGRIDGASHCAACKYNCCVTDADNFIVLFPWERAAAMRAGLDMEHLKAIAGNPQHVHCTRPCTNENDYKPINCATYPLYPITLDLKYWVRGALARCPIPDVRLAAQIKVVASGIREIEKQHPGSIKIMVDFIRAYPGALEVLEYDANDEKLSREQVIAARKLMSR